MAPTAGLKGTFVDTEATLFGEGVTRWKVLNILLAEAIGTGMLVFWGCMGIIVGLSHIEICIAFGLAVATIIQMFGHISAAHLNPSVTVAAVVLGHINVPMAGLYILSQCLGSTLGYKLLLSVTPAVFKVSTCCTVKDAALTDFQGVATEFFLTSLLIFLLCGCWDKRNGHNMDSTALKFGFGVAALALSGGKYTGASMNPARSLGPAIWEWKWTGHWIYWLGPLSAGIIVAAFYRYIFDRPVKDVYVITSEDIPLNETQKQNEMSNA